MKKIINFLFSFSFKNSFISFFLLLISTFIATTFINSTPNICFADSGSYFAQVKTDGVYFCSSTDDKTALFEIPCTYFVEVKGVFGNYYNVKYKNKEGYVRKDGVQLKKETPQTPYLNVTLNVFDPNYLYTTPRRTESSKRITESTLLTYYGTINGEEIQTSKSKWFYVSAVIENKIEYGYVFETFLDQKPIYSPSTENNLTNVGEEVLNQYNTASEGLSTGTKIILIIAISIPSILILYFLVKPTRILQNSKQRKNVKHTKRVHRHGDYFEFDEGEL